ncbi:MAG: menaquinone biosynthesis protein, partial [Flavobacteriaceae bacterium]|nr:menaquinone biosynthesis protein [Flavobacteriaceae bacterium]
NKEIDIGLVPVAVLPSLEEYYIESEYCIGTEGEVASVALFSEVPLQAIETVLLDYQSQTSVALLKYLMKEYWGIHPKIITTKDESYRAKIKGTTAGLVIGDRAFEQRKISTFMFDLGAEWLKITGLPFVFAVWASTQPLPEKFNEEFDKANAVGISRIDEIVKAADFPLFDLRKYYQLHLNYRLDDRKRKGMEVFLNYIQQL